MAGAKPDTWMPMFWGDYLRDTGHLSTAEHGAYILLIGHYWTTGKPIPDSDAVMARITRQGMSNWKKMRDTIAAFFVVEGDLWQHGRIDAELDRAMRFIEKQQVNGAKGGRPSKTQTLPRRIPDQNPNHKPAETTSPSPPNNSSHGDTSTVAVSASASPDGPPRPRLPESAKWAERLGIYRPWLPHGDSLRGKWLPTWGLNPDSAGTNPHIPADLLAAWRSTYASENEKRRGTQVPLRSTPISHGMEGFEQ